MLCFRTVTSKRVIYVNPNHVAVVSSQTADTCNVYVAGDPEPWTIHGSAEDVQQDIWRRVR